MPRLAPLPPETTPELQPHFDFFLGTLGFTPNSVLTMQRRPKLAQALAVMNAAVMDPEGEVDLGFRRLIGHVVSQVSGCRYCQAHTLLGCKGCSRTDFRWDDELGEDGLFVLETNTQPGMTPLSLVPEQAKYCGMSYEDLVETLVEEALSRAGTGGRNG